MNEVVPIANDAFAKFRKEAGLTGEFPSLSVAESESADVEFTLNVWKAIAPYEAISRFAEEYVLYGQVSNTGKVYVGTGATNTDRPTIKLSTRLASLPITTSRSTDMTKKATRYRLPAEMKPKESRSAFPSLRPGNRSNWKR